MIRKMPDDVQAEIDARVASGQYADADLNEIATTIGESNLDNAIAVLDRFFYPIPDGIEVSAVIHGSRDWIGVFTRDER